MSLLDVYVVAESLRLLELIHDDKDLVLNYNDYNSNSNNHNISNFSDFTENKEFETDIKIPTSHTKKDITKIGSTKMEFTQSGRNFMKSKGQTGHIGTLHTGDVGGSLTPSIITPMITPRLLPNVSSNNSLIGLVKQSMGHHNLGNQTPRKQNLYGNPNLGNQAQNLMDPADSKFASGAGTTTHALMDFLGNASGGGGNTTNQDLGGDANTNLGGTATTDNTQNRKEYWEYKGDFVSPRPNEATRRPVGLNLPVGLGSMYSPTMNGTVAVGALQASPKAPLQTSPKAPLPTSGQQAPRFLSAPPKIKVPIGLGDFNKSPHWYSGDSGSPTDLGHHLQEFADFVHHLPEHLHDHHLTEIGHHDYHQEHHHEHLPHHFSEDHLVVWDNKISHYKAKAILAEKVATFNHEVADMVF
jgi:hypothetical protein